MYSTILIMKQVLYNTDYEAGTLQYDYEAGTLQYDYEAGTCTLQY